MRAAEDALAAFEHEAGSSTYLTPLGVREEFEALPVSEQRRILRRIISKAVLSPGRAHVGERLSVEFTDGSVWPEAGLLRPAAG